MSKQMTLGTGFEKYSKTTRREIFLTEMDRIVPWGELCALIWNAHRLFVTCALTNLHLMRRRLWRLSGA